MGGHEACQEVAQLRRLWLITRRIVRHGFCPSDVVDSNHKRLEIRVLRLRTKVQEQETQGEKRDEKERDLQVGVQDQRRAIELDELTLRALEGLGVDVRHVNGHSILLSQNVEVQEAGDDPHHADPETDERGDAKGKHKSPARLAGCGPINLILVSVLAHHDPSVSMSA